MEKGGKTFQFRMHTPDSMFHNWHDRFDAAVARMHPERAGAPSVGLVTSPVGSNTAIEVTVVSYPYDLGRVVSKTLRRY